MVIKARHVLVATLVLATIAGIAQHIHKQDIARGELSACIDAQAHADRFSGTHRESWTAYADYCKDITGNN
jgi:hypothetical protein